MPTTLRPVTDDDRELLLRVYGSTRAEELALVDWSDAQKRAFVEMQFAAQDAHYRTHYPAASFDVVVVDGDPVGRLYVDRLPGEIRVVDVALLPEHRNTGLGTRLVRMLFEEAAASGRTVTLHVEVFNPARRLYERLGFRPVAERGVHVLMAWTPGAGSGSGSGEHRLVAHAPVVGAEGNEEQRELAQVGVPHHDGLLGEDLPAGSVEEERERDAPAVAPLLAFPVPRLVAARQHQLDGLGAGGDGFEHLTRQGRERGAGEALEHAGQRTARTT